MEKQNKIKTSSFQRVTNTKKKMWGEGNQEDLGKEYNIKGILKDGE